MIWTGVRPGSTGRSPSSNCRQTAPGSGGSSCFAGRWFSFLNANQRVLGGMQGIRQVSGDRDRLQTCESDQDAELLSAGYDQLFLVVIAEERERQEKMGLDRR